MRTPESRKETNAEVNTDLISMLKDSECKHHGSSREEPKSRATSAVWSSSRTQTPQAVFVQPVGRRLSRHRRKPASPRARSSPLHRPWCAAAGDAHYAGIHLLGRPEATARWSFHTSAPCAQHQTELFSITDPRGPWGKPTKAPRMCWVSTFFYGSCLTVTVKS